MILRTILSSSVYSAGVKWSTRRFSCSLQHSTAVSSSLHTPDTISNSPGSTVFSSQVIATPACKMPYLEPYRTSIVDPRDHTDDQLSMWYTVPPKEYQTLLAAKFTLHLAYKDLVHTFNEASLMVRRPALSVISYIKQLKLDAITPPKFLFYGANGAGKTCSIAHVTHSLSKDGFVLVMVPWVDRWLKQFLKKPNEVLQSTSVPERWDHTTDAAEWLIFFRTQNSETVNKLQLTATQTYDFSTRESVAAGAPLMSIVELGIARPRLAADCALALTAELKRLATDGKCKVALVMDGINSVFTEKSIYKKDDFDFETKAVFSYIPANEFTLVQAFMNLFSNDWTNGLIVGSVDNNLRKDKDRSSIFPRYLLGEQGWNTLDPFVPVPVPEYSVTEFESAFAYYASKHWIQKPDGLTPQMRQQIAALSARNPLFLVKACAAL